MTRGLAPNGPGGWGRLVGALFSFEAVFIIFLFSGNYKADPRLAWVPIDLTVCFFALGVAMGAIIIWREELYLPGLTVLALAGGFVTWVAISGLWTPSSAYAQDKLVKLVGLNLWCVVATALIMANRPERVRRFLLLLLVFGTAAAVDGIVQYATAAEFALSSRFTLENYLGQGRLYGMGALVAFALWLRTAPFSRRGLVLMVAFAACVYAVLIAGGRGPALAVAVGMLLPLALGVRLPRQHLLVSRALVASLVLLIVMAAVVAYLASSSPDSLRAIKRFDVLLTAEGGGASALRRTQVWTGAWHLWLQHPVFGGGVGSWPLLYFGIDDDRHPHNLILEVLVEFGLVGLLLLAAVIAAACSRVTFARLRAKPALMTAAMLCLSTFLFTLTSGDLTDNRVLFAMLGLLAMRSTRKAMHAGVETRPAQVSVADVRPAYFPARTAASGVASASLRRSGSAPSKPDLG